MNIDKAILQEIMQIINQGHSIEVWYVSLGEAINPCKGKFFIFDDSMYGKVLMFHRFDAGRCVRLMRRAGFKPRNLTKAKYPRENFEF